MFHFQGSGYDFSHKLNNFTVSNDDYSKHLHYFLEIIYFVKGNVEYTIESNSLKLNPGDIIIIAPGKYHFVKINSNVDYDRYVIKLPIEVVPPYLLERINGGGPFYPNNRKFEFTFNQFDNYINNFDENEIITLITSDIIKMLVLLVNQPKTKNQCQNVMVSKIIDYIDSNIKSEINLDTFVDNLHFSKSYIANEFKKYMKIPLMKYIRTKKVIEAHRLILNGEKKTSVAKQLGFEDYSTFYRAYSKLINTYKENSLSETSSLEKDKSEQRNTVKKLINNLTKEYKANASEKILNYIKQKNLVANKNNIFVYLSTENEVSTREFINYLLSLNKNVYVPIIKSNSQLECKKITKDSKYNCNEYGILEPIEGENISKENIDLAFIPCLACDKNHNRLGHGKGYFDSFLANRYFTSYCLCFANVVINKVISDSHDQKVDYIITEEGLI